MSASNDKNGGHASPVAIEQARGLVNSRVDEVSDGLREVSLALHGNPELSYKEFFAHETITTFLEKQGFTVKRKTYGLETSFEATIGTGGRQVVVCAEYDALPNIGHACGHNLIAISSLGAFIGAAQAITSLGLPGRLRILGTPAEEGGGGKVALINAGAFDPPEDIAASIMSHPATYHITSPDASVSGSAAFDLIASLKFHVEFRGKSAHAAGEPWNGVNALDAAVAAYNAVGLLRQQIRPDERIHGVIESGGTVPNVITDYTRMNWYVRAPSTARAEQLQAKVMACMEAGATATGCKVNYIKAYPYKDVISSTALCTAYVEDMAKMGEKVLLAQEQPFNASTDMGNVSHIVPGFHGSFSIPTAPDVALHSTGFAAAAATQEAHSAAIKSAKGMAMLAVRVLADDAVANAAKEEFEKSDRRDR